MALSPEKCTSDENEKLEQRQRVIMELKGDIKNVENNIKYLETIMPDSVTLEETELDKIENNLRHELSVAKTERKEARKRLKKASPNQSGNIPTGTDNGLVRPTQIAERFSELFKKECTNAYKSMKETEQNCVTSLLNVLKDVYTRCETLANDGFFQQVQQCIELPFDCPEISNEPIVMPDLLKQQIKTFRKRRAAVAIKQIQKDMVPTIQIDTRKSSEIQSYVSRCVEICWLMVIQDPPMVFQYGSDGEFDRNKFETHDQYVDYIVWPALLLHDGGKLLSEGKAQGGKEETHA